MSGPGSDAVSGKLLILLINQQERDDG